MEEEKELSEEVLEYIAKRMNQVMKDLPSNSAVKLLQGVTRQLYDNNTKLIEALEHCVRVLQEYERKPGEDLKPFMLGALDNAK